MRFESLIPNLMVEDVSETIRYYKSKLDFTVLKILPEDSPPDWALLKRNDIVLMFQSRKPLSPDWRQPEGRKPGGGITLYIKLKGVRAFYALLEDSVEIISPLEDTFYHTTEFSIMDLNGYIITFSEDKN